MAGHIFCRIPVGFTPALGSSQIRTAHGSMNDNPGLIVNAPLFGSNVVEADIWRTRLAGVYGQSPGARRLLLIVIGLINSNCFGIKNCKYFPPFFARSTGCRTDVSLVILPLGRRKRAGRGKKVYRFGGSNRCYGSLGRRKKSSGHRPASISIQYLPGMRKPRPL